MNSKDALDTYKEWEIVSIGASSSLLPKLPCELNEGNQTLLKTFYMEQSMVASISFRDIIAALKRIGKRGVAMRNHVIPLFLFLGEQYNEKAPWGSTVNQENTRVVIDELYRIFDIEKKSPGPLSAFFQRDFESIGNPSKTMFSHLLKNFRPIIGTQNCEWKLQPAAKQSFLWLLYQIKTPYLGDHLEGCILPALNFFDDFETENVLDGIQALDYIFQNVVKNIVKETGWGLIVYQHLHKSLYIQKETKILTSIVGVIFKVLKHLEPEPHLQPSQFTRYDEVFEIILNQAHISDTNMKVFWLSLLPSLIEVMGHAVLHWNEKIQNILMDSCLLVNTEIWLSILQVVRDCIKNVWPHPRSDGYLEILLRILMNLSLIPNNSNDVDADMRKKIMDLLKDCFEMLHKSNDVNEWKPSLDEILEKEDESFQPGFIKNLKECLQNSA